MPLDSVRAQLRALQSYYTDDTKSDDDIIYAVYNWVGAAHSASQSLIIEGRFPEVHRCLDLCKNTLDELHVGADGRHVVTIVTGEDALLMKSLRHRTDILFRQCEEARKVTQGRDAQYYLNKIISAETEGAGSNHSRSHSPPERSFFFGRRRPRNAWRAQPTFPPLVTQSRPFLRGASFKSSFAAVAADAEPQRSPLARSSDSPTRPGTPPRSRQAEPPCAEPPALPGTADTQKTPTHSAVPGPSIGESVPPLPRLSKAPAPFLPKLRSRFGAAAGEAVRPLSSLSAGVNAVPCDVNGRLVRGSIAVKSVTAVYRNAENKMRAIGHRTARLVGNESVRQRYRCSDKEEDKGNLLEIIKEDHVQERTEDDSGMYRCVSVEVVEEDEEEEEVKKEKEYSLPVIPSHMSLSAAEKLRDVYAQFHIKSGEASEATKEMRRITDEHAALLRKDKLYEPVEDPAMWKSFRRAQQSLSSGAALSDLSNRTERTVRASSPLYRAAIPILSPGCTVLMEKTIVVADVATASVPTLNETPTKDDSPQRDRTGSMTEWRLGRLQNAESVEDAEVHRIVLQQVTERIAEEKRCKRVGKTLAPLEVESKTRNDVCRALDRIKRKLVPSPDMSFTLLSSNASYTSGNNLYKKTVFSSSLLTCDPCSGSRDESAVQALSLASLHKERDWLRINSASIAMCLPLHLATVRLQCHARRVMAWRQCRRRAEEVEAHIRRAEECEEAAIVLQRYARRMLARRTMRTLKLRLVYRNDQRIASETAQGSSVEVRNAANTLSGAEFYDREMGTLLHSPRAPSDCHRDSRDVDARASMSQAYPKSFSRRYFALEEYVTMRVLYIVSTLDLPAWAMQRLRRIQVNIASRVITRNLRAYCNSRATRWEGETRALLLYVTGRLSSAATFCKSSSTTTTLPPLFEFGVLAHEGDAVECLPTRVPLEQSSTTASSFMQTLGSQPTNDQCNASVRTAAFPLSSGCVAGNETTTNDTRTAEVQLCKSFLAPLEHVQLSVLENQLREREARAAEAHADENRRISHNAAALIAQRQQLEAAMLLQRTVRGFAARVGVCRYAMRLRRHMSQRRPRDASSTSTADTSLPSAEMHGAGLEPNYDSEAHPVPREAARALWRGVRRRHPEWFDPRAEERRRRREAAAVTLQAAVRAKQATLAVADRVCDLDAAVIQRQWRAVRTRRAEIASVVDTQRLEVLLGLGF